MARVCELMGVEQAGRVLGVSVATVWRRIRAGEIESVRHGGRRLIPAKALAASRRGRFSDDVPVFDESHPIFRLAGGGRSGGRKPGARDKHAILDD